MLKQKILVVDDDKDVVRLMTAYLEQAGFQTICAYNGQTAIHLLRSEKPDLMLLDLMLPDLDGYDLTRLVRNDPGCITRIWQLELGHRAIDICLGFRLI